MIVILLTAASVISALPIVIVLSRYLYRSNTALLRGSGPLNFSETGPPLITAVYFELAKRYHPDRGNQNTQELMADIDAASTVIMNCRRMG